MMQLRMAGFLPATCLTFAGIDSAERQCASQARANDAQPNHRTAEAEAADSIPYVSPPPMPWPRVFPSL